MLLLFELGVTASFVVNQTLKIWQTATLHHILWSAKKFFEDLSHPEEVDFSKSSLLNDHVWRQQRFLCTLKAHQSKWNRFSHSLAFCMWAEVKWDHGSTAPNLQTWNTSLLSLSSLGCCLPQWPLLSPVARSPAQSKPSRSSNYISSMQTMMNETAVYCISVWFFCPQTKYSF